MEKLILAKSEYSSADNNSEPATHFAEHSKHSLLRRILLTAPKHGRARKNLEKFLIAKLKPSFNRQEDSNMLAHFRKGAILLSLLVR